jgi:hypothetical protein
MQPFQRKLESGCRRGRAFFADIETLHDPGQPRNRFELGEEVLRPQELGSLGDKTLLEQLNQRRKVLSA